MDEDRAPSMAAYPAPPTPTKAFDWDAISTSASETEMEDEHDDKGASAAEPAGSPEPAPEVRCLWEDCGETFTDLQPFIAHLHSCTCRLLTQSILASTNRAMRVNGLAALAKARAKRRALRC